MQKGNNESSDRVEKFAALRRRDRPVKVMSTLATGPAVFFYARIPWFLLRILGTTLQSLGLFLYGGVRKFRFTLSTLVLISLWGGTSGTLLTLSNRTVWFSLGLVSSLVLIVFVLTSILRANIPAELLDAD